MSFDYAHTVSLLPMQYEKLPGKLYEFKLLLPLTETKSPFTEHYYMTIVNATVMHHNVHLHVTSVAEPRLEKSLLMDIKPVFTV